MKNRKIDFNYSEVADNLDEDLSKQKQPSAKVVRKIQKLKKKEDYLLRIDKRIPLTDIPIRHFKAMLKKDIILWTRSWRRMAFEIVFPILIFVVIAVIRKHIPVKISDSHNDLTRYIAPLSPLATPERVGISGWKDDNETVFNSTLLIKDQQLILSSILDF